MSAQRGITSPSGLRALLLQGLFHILRKFQIISLKVEGNKANRRDWQITTVPSPWNMALARLDHKSSGRVPTGHADEVVISDSSFHQQRLAYERSSGELASKKRKREGRGDSSIVYGDTAYRGPWARYEERRPDVSDDDDSGDEEVEVVYEEDEIAPQPEAPKTKAGTSYGDTRDGAESSEFHGSEEHDYQGRTYMHIPQDLGNVDLRRQLVVEDLKNYHPKKEIHRWKMSGSGNKAITQTPIHTGLWPSHTQRQRRL